MVGATVTCFYIQIGKDAILGINMNLCILFIINTGVYNTIFLKNNSLEARRWE